MTTCMTQKATRRLAGGFFLTGPLMAFSVKISYENYIVSHCAISANPNSLMQYRRSQLVRCSDPDQSHSMEGHFGVEASTEGPQIFLAPEVADSAFPRESQD